MKKNIEINYNKYPLPDRKRHHTNPSFYIPMKELKFAPAGYPQVIKAINWAEYFINQNPPTRLDIGCGRGLFLLSVAENYKDSNILGIEVRQWCCQWLRHYIVNERVENCGILHYCVANRLDFINTESIKEVFYLFPDPWTKVKHRKRRAFNLDFLVDIYRILEKGGKLYLATDIYEIHTYHLAILKTINQFLVKEVNDSDEWTLPPTNKELFCIKENIKYYRIIAKKRID